MFSPEKTQVEICLLKSNLDEIGNELVVQRSAWPKFDAENDRKFRESLNAVRVSRALCVEIEKLNQENVRLVAKRMRLKMQGKELAKSLEKARTERGVMETESLKENQEIEQLIRKYEDAIREQTTKLRETRACFNEGEMKTEIEKVNNIILGLEGEIVKRKSIVEGKAKYLEGLTPDVPEDLLVTAGKNELDEKIKSLSEKCATLEEKRNDLMKNRNNASFLGAKK